MSFGLYFIAGLFIGSFLNVLVDRLPRGETVVKGKSYCESCKHPLRWYDLIPLFSYLQLQGKCRYCRVSLSLYYPIVELVTGVGFAATFLFWIHGGGAANVNSYAYLLVLLYIISTFIVVFFSDLKYGLIPFAVVAPSVVIFSLYLLVFHPFSLLSHLLAAFGAGLFFFFLYVLTKGRGMGFGDVVLVFYLGLILGYPNIVVGLYLAFLTGALVSLILILGKKKKFRGSIIPFGPFLVIGACISLFYGEQLVEIAMRFLG